MNDTIKLLMRHRSIRKYGQSPIPDEHIRAILAAAQQASSSSNMQAYSVVGVTDAETKRRLAEATGGQAYVAECPLFLVWCADLKRVQTAAAFHGVDHVPNTVENFLIATVDTALAAQNAAVAAESLGLGVCYIGGIRNNPRVVVELLQLPNLVYPVFGMCVGQPEQDPLLRPRLPLDTVYHDNVYSGDGYDAGLRRYDETMTDYMVKRTGGKRSSNWSEDMAAKLRQPLRTHMRGFLKEQGFELE